MKSINWTKAQVVSLPPDSPATRIDASQASCEPTNGWISPVDGHRHYSDQARADCAVCTLVAERDALQTRVAGMGPRARAVVGAAMGAAETTTWRKHEAERTRLRKVAKSSVVAIETLLADDRTDLAADTRTILGRVSAVLKEALDGDEGET